MRTEMYSAQRQLREAFNANPDEALSRANAELERVRQAHAQELSELQSKVRCCRQAGGRRTMCCAPPPHCARLSHPCAASLPRWITGSCVPRLRRSRW